MRKYMMAAVPLLALLASCGGKEEAKQPPKPAGPDYSKMTSVTEVDKAVPANLTIPYQQLFGCTFDLAAKQGKPVPQIDPRFAGNILETVRKDPSAGEKCLAELRGGPAPAPSARPEAATKG
jgi:hypothetical protein